MRRHKSIAGLAAFSLLLGCVTLPVKAADMEIGEAFTTIPEEEVQAFSEAVMPEDLEGFSSELIEAYDAEEFSLNEYELGVLYLTNKIRMANGIAPLSMQAGLQKVADIREPELLDKFDHERPNGTDCFTALTECGVPWETAGENIAAGQFNPQMVITSWWNSPGHKKNMLTPEFSHLGVGYTYKEDSEYGHYWVQMFTGTCEPDSISLTEDNSVPFIMKNDQTIDEMGLMLQIECHHGTSYMPVTEEMCSEVDMSLLKQKQTVTISYKGKSTTVDIMLHEPMPFGDVSPESWYYDYVEEVYYNEIMTGLDGTTFGPEQNLARAQFAVILHRLMDVPEVEYKAVFPDVKDGEWYTDAILWASENKIVTGYSDTGNFGPGDNINREQMAVMMYRFAKFLQEDVSQTADYSRFSDAGYVNEFAQEAMSWAVGMEIISGKDDGTRLDPQGNASRAECATIIMRFLEKYVF